MSKKKQYNLKAKIKEALRHVHRFYPVARRVSKLSETRKGYRQCAICLEEFENKHTRLDHIEPVEPILPPDNSDDWKFYLIDRMFVDETEYQTLCISCHAEKTYYENNERRRLKKIGTIS